MDYDIILLLIIFMIGFIGSFVSGMLGVGGAVVNYPMLLMIPTALGVGSFTAHEVSGITAVQVLFTTVVGALAYRKGGYLNKKVIIYMGGGVLLGSLAGGFMSSAMPESGINIVYGLLALAAVVMMIIPHGGEDDLAYSTDHFNRLLGISSAFIVGLGAGIVGAGGAFLLVPVMLTLLKLPTRTAIASSLAITFLSSIGSAGSKLIMGQVLFIPAIVMIIASLIASPLGAKVGKKMNTKFLEKALAALIFIIAVKIWFDIFAGH
ncbi:sulfite exporter TauE/SafE family protein [Aciduricibacillus chroicocephali]|uniref:Probable membrane transporter protein n=1 Tax=Aciduricibacillus chroicocephali TaxID=3054939 RepID=A0ABY9KWH7_9BACI|nr:sulfite exporter TauE/SafE family protein [Bacillaceae bacterium 44XB]